MNPNILGVLYAALDMESGGSDKLPVLDGPKLAELISELCGYADGAAGACASEIESFEENGPYDEDAIGYVEDLRERESEIRACIEKAELEIKRLRGE